MLESIFVTLLAISFVTFVLAVEKWSIIYSSVSLILWLIIMASSFYVQVPGDTNYSDATINAICLAFIFINIILMVIIHFRIGQPKYPIGSR